MNWIIGNSRHLVLTLKSKVGLYHVLHTTAKTSPKKLNQTVVETQQMPDTKKADTVKVNFVVYRNRNSLYLKNNETDLNLTEYQSLLTKEFIY